ncbi:MAG: hypothetical protein A2X64_06040 [Ignavibacteria bacterium GWF2_33_9]|nr:MAG: hypothetical protein A2X64_06040 [Ignavibacteria bacterium GWF2_33_9]
MDSKKNDNLKYLGIVSSVNPAKNLIVLSDFPKNLPDLNNNFEIEIGFSVNFTNKYSATHLVNHGKYVTIVIEKKITEDMVDIFIRKAVYTEFENLSKEAPDLILPEDILGLQVFDEMSGNLIGIVKDIMLNPANQVWIVESEEFMLPIPYTPNVVKKVDLKKNVAYIEMIDGLMDLAELKNAPKKERVFKKRGSYRK